MSKYWKLRKYLQPSRWLDSWLKREFQALMQEEDVNIVMHHFLGVIISFLNSKEKKDLTKPPETKQKEFHALVIEARSERFVKEVKLFLASGLNIEAYDDVCMHELGRSRPEAAGEASERGVVEMPVIPFLYVFDEDSD